MKIALLTHARAAKGAAVAAALAACAVKVDLMVCEEPRVAPTGDRMRQLLLERGLRGVVEKFLPAKDRGGAAGATAPHDAGAPPADAATTLDAAGYAARFGIPLLHLPDLASLAALDRLRAAQIDLMIHAGAGILRQPLLDIPRLGVLNAHMGVLPRYRGMNVAEWAAWEGGAIGATLHWIDPGIDTGRIIRIVEVARDGLTSVAALRAAVDTAQRAALAELVAEIVATGKAPPDAPQRAEDGRQYFTMHPQIRNLLDQCLAQSR
ncbi:MAG: hypothetical protein K2Y20_14175 [Sphingomonas sp.]|nr:hypothetical protein [Sphingomonas sp.]